MRSFLALSLLILIGISCNNPADKSADKTAAADTTKPVYAYTIQKPDNWDIGSSKNTAAALSALKAYESNKVDESLSYFADTVQWRSDFIDSKYPKDSLKAIISTGWATMSRLKIEIDDFESVISKDKKEEYVTVWFKEISTDKKGKIDSIAVINDFKFSNGKIVGLDETTRHYPLKK